MDRIILNEQGVKNLRIEMVQAEQRDFETTVFAIGRIEEIPAYRSVLSSRVPGRVVKLNAFEGDRVRKGDVLAEIESRQIGDPPPVIALKAPRDGLVVSSRLRLGEPVEPDKELLDIVDRSEMWAVAKIPETAAALISAGCDARIHVPALGDETIRVKLLRFGVDADRVAGTIDGIFIIPNRDGKLQPGMRVEFSIVTSSRPNVMSVPREAIQGDPARRVLFVKDFELPYTFIRVPVVVGEKNDDYVEIVSGLFPGDDVVTRGSYLLGFVGSGSGLSLKEALDAAHGHEHNEDGSEMTADQKAGKSNTGDGGDTGDTGPSMFLIYYAVVMTFMFIVAMQRLSKAGRRKSKD